MKPQDYFNLLQRYGRVTIPRRYTNALTHICNKANVVISKTDKDSIFVKITIIN